MKRNTLLNALLVAAVGFGLAFTAQAQNAKVGALQIENAYTRSTVPGQMAAGGFMKIENKGGVETGKEPRLPYLFKGALIQKAM